VRYGVTSGFISNNPLVVQFQPIWKYVRGEWRREKQIAADSDSSEHSVSSEWRITA